MVRTNLGLYFHGIPYPRLPGDCLMKSLHQDLPYLGNEQQVDRCTSDELSGGEVEVGKCISKRTG